MEVVVEAGSRLHAGFHYIGGGIWAGCGFYAERPRLRIRARSCDNGGYSGARELAGILKRLLDTLDGVCIDVLEEIPAHMGLGSTTQTTLAVGLAHSIIYKLDNRIDSLAYRLGRGRYSWVGTLLFMHGGFVVDAGTGLREPRVMSRLDVPDDWRFLIVLPKLRRGYSEEIEEELLSGVKDPLPRTSSLMARGALMLMMGVARRDLGMALKGLKSIQLGTGLYFSGYQGGRYRSDVMDIVGEAERNGIILAQSSWGPTLYTITTVEQARGDAYIIKTILKETGIEGDVIISRPRNKGASAIKLVSS